MLKKSSLAAKNVCALLAAAAALVGVNACGKGTPVAPSSAVLTLSANPIEIGYGEMAVLSLSALRSTGNPVNPGTEIVLTTTLGSVPNIVTTDERGLATAHLTAGQTAGTATITAASGGATAVTITVEIGETVGSLNLTGKPTRFKFTGGRSELRLFVLDRDGQPLSGASVFFSSTAGRLDSGGQAVPSNGQGEATDTLRLNKAEAALVAGGSVQVTARVVVGGVESTTSIDLPVDPAPAP